MQRDSVKLSTADRALPFAETDSIFNFALLKTVLFRVGIAQFRSIFRTYFDYVTLDVSRTFKVNRSKVKVTA